MAQQMANHESARTTGLYDRLNGRVSLDEVERILIRQPHGRRITTAGKRLGGLAQPGRPQRRFLRAAARAAVGKLTVDHNGRHGADT